MGPRGQFQHSRSCSWAIEDYSDQVEANSGGYHGPTVGNYVMYDQIESLLS
jgi:hypothetical protein